MGTTEFSAKDLRGDRQVIRVATRERIAEQFNEDPGTIATTMRGALEGDRDAYGDLCAMFDRYLLTDLALRAKYEKRRRKLCELPYQITNEDEDKQGEKIAEEIERGIANIDEFETNFMWELSDAIGKGMAAVELQGELQDGKLQITGAKGVPQYALRNPKDEDGNILEDQWEHKTKSGWQPVSEGKLLFWKRQNQGTYFTSGLMWPIMFYACFKKFTIKDWLSFVEVYGVPLRVGKYPDHYKPDSTEVDVLAAAVIDIASDAGVVIPDSMKIDFVEAIKGSSSDAFERICNYFDNLISELLLGGTLTSQAGEKGARSLGEVHQEETESIVAFDALSLAAAISTGLIKPWVRANHGERKAYPKFAFQIININKLAKWWEIHQGLAERGFPIPLRFLSETYHVPLPDGDEPVLQSTSAPGQSPLPAGRTQAESFPPKEPRSVMGDDPPEPFSTFADDPTGEMQGDMEDAFAERTAGIYRGLQGQVIRNLAKKKA